MPPFISYKEKGKDAMIHVNVDMVTFARHRGDGTLQLVYKSPNFDKGYEIVELAGTDATDALDVMKLR